MSIQTVWLGHTFSVHLPSVEWSTAAGIYIFCGVSPQNKWTCLYVGQTVSFQARPGRPGAHDRWKEAVALGATHVHAMVVPLQAGRDRIERELIAGYKPPLNVHHVNPQR